MPKSHFGHPLWLDRVPARRRPGWSRHRGHLDTAVAVVGGGLTGCTIAWAFASAGVNVTLFEADRIGQGMGGVRGLGLLRPEPDADFQDVVGAYGKRAARHLWREIRRASLDFAAALRRLGVACDLGASDAIWIAATTGDETRLRRELKARRDTGVTQDGASWLGARQLHVETAVTGRGGIRIRGAGSFDPYRATLGLARAAAAKGAAIFERSEVVRVRAGRRAVEIRTAGGGTVTAERVVHATGYPIRDLRALWRHFAAMHTYVVATEPLPAPMRREVGRRATTMRDSVQPPHFLRWGREDRILFAGADQPAVADRARPKTLVQRAGQLMYELSLAYPAISGLPAALAWDAAYAATRDGLPYFGPHRNYPRQSFAMGHGRHGGGLSFLAARLLLRQHLEAPDKGDELFAFTRTV